VKNKNKVKSVKISFTGGNLTNYSGIYPLFKFMKKMRLNHLFEQKISLTEKANQKYSLSQILNAIILGALSGMNRFIKIENFTLDPLVRHLLDIQNKLDIDTIRIFKQHKRMPFSLAASR
jgi:organic radical activating enzyme